MALLKSMLQPTGVAATYHRITQGTVDFTTGKTALAMESYVDAAARQAGCSPIAAYSLTLDTMPSFNGDPRPWAYAQFKARPEWADAQDV